MGVSQKLTAALFEECRGKGIQDRIALTLEFNGIMAARRHASTTMFCSVVPLWR